MQALSYLHEHGIAHRRLTLSNLLLVNGTLKLTGFGEASDANYVQLGSPSAGLVSGRCG